MPWLKRNAGLVVTGVVLLGLLGFAAFYLLQKKANADEAAAQLEASTEELKRLVARNPGVSVENIDAAKQDQARLEQFLEEVKRAFGGPSEPVQVSNREFGVLLDSTLNELRRQAERADVKLPAKDYQFSFSSQVKSVNIQSSALQPLAEQLKDIDAICRILFGAKINEFDGIKRPTVTSDELAGSGDFLTAKAATNDWTIVTPYDVSFRGFSGELAAVLEGFIKSTNVIVVKNVVVQKSDAADEAGDGQMTPGVYSMPMQPGMSPGGNPYGNRYGMPMRAGPGGGMSPGLASRYGLRPAPQVPVAPTTPQYGRRGPRPIQEEKLLKVTLSLETVRVRPVSGGGRVARTSSPGSDFGTDPANQ